jgi:hypothetical protein
MVYRLHSNRVIFFGAESPLKLKEGDIRNEAFGRACYSAYICVRSARL